MRLFLSGLACSILAACSGGGDTRGRSLYDGTDVAQDFDDPGANPVKDEVRSLPFRHIVWEHKLAHHQIRRLTVAGNLLFAETPTNEVVAIDRFVGDVRWIYKIDSETPLDFPPIVAHGVPELILKIEKELFEINREIDSILKEKGPGEETQKLQKTRAEKRNALQIAQTGDNVYFLSRQVLYCLDRESGNLRWTNRLDFIPSSQPFATQFYVFVPSAELSRVYVLSVKDKAEPIDYFRADIDETENHITNRPVYEDPSLVFVSHDGQIYFFSVKERKRSNSFLTGGPIKADPIIHRHVRKIVEKDKDDPTKTTVSERVQKLLFVGSMDNAFYALEADSGQLLWKYECASAIKSAAIAKDATVYVKSEEGALFAFNVAPMHTASDGSVLGPKRNGELRWKIPLGERFLMKGKAYVYILGPKSEIYAMEEMTGDIVGRYKTKHLRYLITNTADDYFYCATPAGQLFALKETKEND